MPLNAINMPFNAISGQPLACLSAKMYLGIAFLTV